MTNPSATPADSQFPANFHVAVDIVALTIKRGLLQVAVVQRQGAESCISVDGGPARLTPRSSHDYALPGGHVHWQNENLKQAAQRELFEETQIEVSLDDLEQIGAYGDVGRDPRPGRTISVAYVAFHPEFSSPFAGSDAEHAKFTDVIDLLAKPNRLEFDHRTILRDAIAKVRDLMERTPIALKFCQETFTLLELRNVYEVMFHRAYSADRSDAKTQRDAERIRRFDQTQGDSPLQEAIAQFSLLSFNNELRSEQGFASRPRGLASSRHVSSEFTVVDKIQKLLTDEFRKPSGDRPVFKNSFDPANFLRKATAIDGFIEPMIGRTQIGPSGTGKPAQVYRRGKAKRLDPPLIVERKPSKKYEIASEPRQPKK